MNTKRSFTSEESSMIGSSAVLARIRLTAAPCEVHRKI